MRVSTLVLPLLAAIGIGTAVAVSVKAVKPKPVQIPVALPARAPFDAYIGGAGLVEASSQNVSIGTSVNGIVAAVLVSVGQQVRSGDPLFQIDDRELRSQLTLRQANLVKAQTAREEARASMLDFQAQYELVRDAADSRVVSTDDVQRRRHGALLASAKLTSAQASVASAMADIAATRASIERLTVRSPLDGQVLQINLRPGEFATAGAQTLPLLRLGNLDRLHLRVDIDENDAWRFVAGMRAIGSIRGNSDLKAHLTFVRVEPFVTPKVSLTGNSNERVDTRVLQVVFSMERDDLPLYVGQQMDVFIEVPPAQAVRKRESGVSDRNAVSSPAATPLRL